MFIQIATKGRISFSFSQLSSILCVYLSTLSVYLWFIHLIHLSFHPSMDTWLLPYFGYYKQCHELAWGCICLFEWVFFLFFKKYPEMELLDSMVVLLLMFWRPCILFSTVAAPIYVPNKIALRFPFLHILTQHLLSIVFWWRPSWQLWGGISLWFWFAFPSWLVMLNIFSFYFIFSIYFY